MGSKLDELIERAYGCDDLRDWALDALAMLSRIQVREQRYVELEAQWLREAEHWAGFPGPDRLVRAWEKECRDHAAALRAIRTDTAAGVASGECACGNTLAWEG